MTSTAVARPQELTAAQLRQKEARIAILGTVERYSDEIGKLAPRGVAPAMYLASLRLYLAQHPALLECTPISVAQGILRVAQTGLDLGVSCDLLPFKQVCQFSPRYNGIIELSLAAGARSVNADVVVEGDLFEYEKGTKFKLRHHRNHKPEARITHSYAIAELKPGSFVFEVMSRAEVDVIRQQYSKSWWKDRAGNLIDLDDIGWYAKKSAVRRLSPYLPKNARFAAALMYADEAESQPESSEYEFVGRPNLDTLIAEGSDNGAPEMTDEEILSRDDEKRPVSGRR